MADYSIALPDLTLSAGTYWLQFGGAVSTTDDEFWDESDGPSTAWAQEVGYSSLRSFQSNTFQILGSEAPATAAPEPAAVGLLGFGLVAIGSLSFRRTGRG